MIAMFIDSRYKWDLLVGLTGGTYWWDLLVGLGRRNLVWFNWDLVGGRAFEL